MATAKPSPMLVMDLDEALLSKDVRLEVNRCYPNVATVQIRTHETPADGAHHNTLRLMVLYGLRNYLDATQEGADALWDEVMEQWLRSIIYKVSNQMKIYNRRQREIDGTELYFDFLILELQGGELEVRLRLDSNSSIDTACVSLVTQVRALLNEGALGTGVTGVQLPSDASYAAQYEAGMAAKAEREAEAAAQEAAAEQARLEAAQAAEEQAEEAFLESPELAEEDRPADEVDLEALGYEIEKKFSFPEADFALDYTVWQVAYADGTAREYDSATGAFVA